FPVPKSCPWRAPLRDRCNMRTVIPLTLCAAIGAATLAAFPLSAQTPAGGLRSPDAFASITNSAERSRALFAEAAKVITGPRCMNCHRVGEPPTQGNDMHEHQPRVFRGDNGNGIAGAMCSTCHTDRNFTLFEGATYRSIPGNPRWGLAPIEM